jgi:hypothetical protein
LRRYGIDSFDQGGTMRIVIAVAVLGVAVAATANPVPTPWPYVFADFAGPPGGDYLPQVFPSANDVVDCYIGMACSDGELDESFRSVALRLEYVGQIFPLEYECLIPGAELYGWWDDSYGIEIRTSQCIDWTGPVYLARVSILYLGVPTDILIQDHAERPRWVVDCNDDVQIFCVSGHGALGKYAMAGDPECAFECYQQAAPVSDASWGTVKALYR